MNWNSKESELWTDGYSEQTPSYRAAEIDAPIAEAITCPRCSGLMDYRPFRKPGSYRAFAVCHNYHCGGFVEF